MSEGKKKDVLQVGIPADQIPELYDKGSMVVASFLASPVGPLDIIVTNDITPVKDIKSFYSELNKNTCTVALVQLSYANIETIKKEVIKIDLPVAGKELIILILDKKVLDKMMRKMNTEETYDYIR